MNEIFDEVGAGKYLGSDENPVSPRTLQRWRMTGDGPEYMKFGRNVRYERAALDAFKGAHRRTSTSDAA
jgi:hypothetical protein